MQRILVVDDDPAVTGILWASVYNLLAIPVAAGVLYPAKGTTGPRRQHIQPRTVGEAVRSQVRSR